MTEETEDLRVFRRWCDNIDGSIVEEDRRLICQFPNDAGEAIWNDGTLTVEDRSTTQTRVETRGRRPTRENGPFRSDRTHPPRESIERVRDMKEFHRASPLEVDDHTLTAGDPSYESMSVSVVDDSPQARLEDRFGDMTRQEIERRIESISQRDQETARLMREDLKDSGLL